MENALRRQQNLLVGQLGYAQTPAIEIVEHDCGGAAAIALRTLAEQQAMAPPSWEVFDLANNGMLRTCVVPGPGCRVQASELLFRPTRRLTNEDPIQPPTIENPSSGRPKSPSCKDDFAEVAGSSAPISPFHKAKPPIGHRRRLWPNSRLKVIVTLALSVLLLGIIWLVALEVRETLLLQGRVDEARLILLALGVERFHEAPPAKVREQIERIDEVDKLEKMSRRLGKVNTWKELVSPQE